MKAVFHARLIFGIAIYFAVVILAPAINAETTKSEPAAQGFVRHLDKLHDKLRLKPDQQTLWDVARKKSIEVQTDVRNGKRAMVELSDAELEKPAPDLVMISRKFDELEQRNMALENQMRPLWLKIYETMSPEQVAIVREALKTELKHYKFFANMRERFM